MGMRSIPSRLRNQRIYRALGGSRERDKTITDPTQTANYQLKYKQRRKGKSEPIISVAIEDGNSRRSSAVSRARPRRRPDRSDLNCVPLAGGEGAARAEPRAHGGGGREGGSANKHRRVLHCPGDKASPA